MRARETAVKQAAELKLVHTSFYAPQIYLYRSNGTFATAFGEKRGRHPVLVYGRTALEVWLDGWRERFWPTSKEQRAEVEATAAALKAQEDLERTAKWRIKTWPGKFARRVKRQVVHLLQHGSFAAREVVPYVSPFGELDGLGAEELGERLAREQIAWR